MKKLIAVLWILSLLLLCACTGTMEPVAEEKEENKPANTEEENAAILGDTVSYTLGEVYCTEKLLPKDTSGFHKYYEASEGNTLFIVEADITNITEDLYRIWTLAEAKLTIANADYEANIAVLLDGQDDSFGNGNVEIDAGETFHVYYIFDIPASSAAEEATFSMTANEETQNHTLKAE